MDGYDGGRDEFVLVLAEVAPHTQLERMSSLDLHLGSLFLGEHLYLLDHVAADLDFMALLLLVLVLLFLGLGVEMLRFQAKRRGDFEFLLGFPLLSLVCDRS